MLQNFLDNTFFHETYGDWAKFIIFLFVLIAIVQLSIEFIFPSA